MNRTLSNESVKEHILYHGFKLDDLIVDFTLQKAFKLVSYEMVLNQLYTKSYNTERGQGYVFEQIYHKWYYLPETFTHIFEKKTNKENEVRNIIKFRELFGYDKFTDRVGVEKLKRICTRPRTIKKDEFTEELRTKELVNDTDLIRNLHNMIESFIKAKRINPNMEMNLKL